MNSYLNIIIIMIILFSEFLAALLKEFGYQTALLRLADDWKKAFDRRRYVGKVMMELSFDCLPHELIVARLKVYGLSTDACIFLNSYLSNRKQRLKIGRTHSIWLNMLKDVPHGPTLGPIIV